MPSYGVSRWHPMLTLDADTGEGLGSPIFYHSS